MQPSSCPEFFHPGMAFDELTAAYDRLQLRFGDPALHAVYGGGCRQSPALCFVFMNPTGRNRTAQPGWEGIHAPWIGTGRVWRIFASLGLLPEELAARVISLKPDGWTPALAEELYSCLSDRGIYVTNRGKCTLPDARPIPDRVYREYLPFLRRELELVQPKRIVAFGNQVSSLLLGKPVSVSRCRGLSFPLEVGGSVIPLWPVYYPVGNGSMHLTKAMEDLKVLLTEAGFVAS